MLSSGAETSELCTGGTVLTLCSRLISILRCRRESTRGQKSESIGYPVMVSHCANSSCHARFKYLRDGRLFQFPARKSETKVLSNGSGFGLWWLCTECAKTMTLVADGNFGVKLIPLPSAKEPRRVDPTGTG